MVASIPACSYGDKKENNNNKERREIRMIIVVTIRKKEEKLRKRRRQTQRSLSRTGGNVVGLMTDDKNQGLKQP